MGHYTCMQCGTSHLQTVQETLLSHIILATYRTFRVAAVKTSVVIFTPTPDMREQDVAPW